MFADASTTLLGPCPSDLVEESENINISAKEVNHILAGFIYGMTSQNHLTELEACYNGGSGMDKELMTAIHLFKAGGWNNITQGVLNILLVGFQIPQELHTCEGMQDDLTAIKDWASIFTNKSKLISKVTRHFLTHKDEATADIA